MGKKPPQQKENCNHFERKSERRFGDFIAESNFLTNRNTHPPTMKGGNFVHQKQHLEEGISTPPLMKFCSSKTVTAGGRYFNPTTVRVSAIFKGSRRQVTEKSHTATIAASALL
jgi:hypothetical protein